MTGYLILATIIIILGLIIFISATRFKSLKTELAKDEAEIKFDNHLIKAMNDAIVEDGKITREANEKRNEIAGASTANDVIELFNKL